MDLSPIWAPQYGDMGNWVFLFSPSSETASVVGCPQSKSNNVRTRHQQDNNVASQADWLTRIFFVTAKALRPDHTRLATFSPRRMLAPAHVQAATLDKFLASWKHHNPENTMALWSDDFTQRILSLSLGMPVNSRIETEAFYPNLVKSLTNWQVMSLRFLFSFRLAVYYE